MQKLTDSVYMPLVLFRMSEGEECVCIMLNTNKKIKPAFYNNRLNKIIKSSLAKVSKRTPRVTPSAQQTRASARQM